MYFDKPYNRQEFLTIFQTKICPNFVRQERPLDCKRETKYFEKDKILSLGKVQFDNWDVLDVREIQQKSNSDPRVTITRDAFKVMKDIWKSNVLILFHSPDNSSYRLSFLTLKQTWEWTQESSPKRYSFLLGPHEKVKTPNDYLIKNSKGTIQSLEDLVSRFDVEVVRKEFFRLYLNLFLELYKSLHRNTDFKNEVIGKHGQDPVKFTKNLMGKIIFLYFVQKKWRLWVPENKKRWEWDMDFIKTLYEDSISGENMIINELKRKNNFYNDYLEPLFYGWLSEDRSQQNDIHPHFKSKNDEKVRIPYLNGWLFSKEYDREHTDILPENKIFEDIVKSFDRYNFTIDEDDPYDREVAIDPEMLWKIFETMISVSSDNIDEILELYEKKTKWNPLDIDNIQHIDIENELNKKFGAFYTPREIVHYMTKESLLYYLVNGLKERGKYAKDKSEQEVQKFLEEKVRLLMKYKDNYLTMTDVKQRVTWDVEIFFDVVWYIDRLLDDVKVLDPAVGSGAFPMGLLHEIRSLKKYINDIFLERHITDYEIKKNIISKSVYGVDIEPGAIDIARLRFWLSLLVDTDKPEPLPNLEFKFVCADTLTPLYDEKNTLDLYQNNIMFGKYKFFMQKLFYPTKEYPKEESMTKLKHFITYFQGKDQTEFNQKLRTFDPFNSDNSAKFFDPELMFGEEKFDIVIWNPPYVLIQDIDNNGKLMKSYSSIYQVAQYKVDLYHLFFERWINSLKNNWVISYITPNTFLTNKHTDKLRGFMVSETDILKIINCNFEVFDSASVDTSMTILSKTKNEENMFESYIRNQKEKEPKLSKKTLQKDLRNSPWYVIPISDTKEIGDIEHTQPLSKIAKSYFWIQAYDKKTSTHPNDTGGLKPIIDWSEIKHFWIANPISYFDFLPQNIKSWGDWDIYKNDRIIIRQIWKTPVVGYVKWWILSSNTMYSILPLPDSNIDLHYLLCILCSNFIKYWWITRYSDNKKLFPKIKWYQIKELPIPIIPLSEQAPFIEISKRILQLEVSDLKNDLEKQVNEMTYKLYGLTSEEVKVVEKSVK